MEAVKMFLILASVAPVAYFHHLTDVEHCLIPLLKYPEFPKFATVDQICYIHTASAACVYNSIVNFPVREQRLLFEVHRGIVTSTNYNCYGKEEDHHREEFASRIPCYSKTEVIEQLYVCRQKFSKQLEYVQLMADDCKLNGFCAAFDYYDDCLLKHDEPCFKQSRMHDIITNFSYLFYNQYHNLCVNSGHTSLVKSDLLIFHEINREEIPPATQFATPLEVLIKLFLWFEDNPQVERSNKTTHSPAETTTVK